MQEFTFKYQNKKAGGYFLLGILGVPAGMLTISGILFDYVPWIFWISIPLMIALIVYCMKLFIKKSRAIDTIQIDDDGFTSKSYGRVLYADIHSIPPYGALQAPPPSMRIKLNNGAKLVWYLDANNAKASEDVNTFIAFRAELLNRLKQRTSVEYAAENTDHQATRSASKAIEDEPVEHIETSAYCEPEKQTEKLIEQLESHKKRDYKYITIPVSLVFALFIFFRTCGEDFFREKRENEMNVIRNSVLHMEDNYKDNIQKSKAAIDAYTKKFGPVTLLTNDSLAEVKFLPDIKKDGYRPEINVIGLRRQEDNELLEKIIKHPDSVDYRMIAYRPKKEFLIALDQNFLSDEDSTASTVYFAVYNPDQSLPSTLRNRTDTTFQPICYSTSVSIPKTGIITNADFKNMDFASIRSILYTFKGTYFYMAVKEQDGISPERYEKIRSIVLKDFNNYEIDTEQFETRRFNVY